MNTSVPITSVAVTIISRCTLSRCAPGGKIYWRRLEICNYHQSSLTQWVQGVSVHLSVSGQTQKGTESFHKPLNTLLTCRCPAPSHQRQRFSSLLCDGTTHRAFCLEPLWFWHLLSNRNKTVTVTNYTKTFYWLLITDFFLFVCRGVV